MMTKKELIDMSVIVQFPNYMRNGDYDISTTSIYEYKKDTEEILIPKGTVDDRFIGWSTNNHHFNNYFHAKYALPAILDKLLGIRFNINDFEWIDYKYNGYDLTYLKPKKDYHFSVDAYNKHAEGGFDILRANDIITRNDMAGVAPTEYHMQYVGAHNCARIVNFDAPNNNRLYVSGDSHMIPLVPILACYFREIVSVDFRYKKSQATNKNLDFIYTNNKFTHCLIQISGANSAAKYFDSNFNPGFVSWLDNDQIAPAPDVINTPAATIAELDKISDIEERKIKKRSAISMLLKTI